MDKDRFQRTGCKKTFESRDELVEHVRERCDETIMSARERYIISNIDCIILVSLIVC